MSYHLDHFNNLQLVFLVWLLPFCGQLLQMVIAAMKLKDAYSLEGKLWPT